MLQHGEKNDADHSVATRGSGEVHVRVAITSNVSVEVERGRSRGFGRQGSGLACDQDDGPDPDESAVCPPKTLQDRLKTEQYLKKTHLGRTFK